MEEQKMSKATYVEPKMDVIVIQTADIITASTDSFNGEWVPIGGQKDQNGFLPSE